MEQQQPLPSPLQSWAATPSAGSRPVSSMLNADDFLDIAPPPNVFWPGRKSGIFWDPQGADQFTHTLSLAGLGFEPNQHYLDFGCASGRTVRTLAAAFPRSRWRGCDPIEVPIEWAREAMPHIDFRVSPEVPPTRFDDETICGTYAASVWSHFAKTPALEWMDEMHRILVPGGWLAFSTHGIASIRKGLQKEPEKAAEQHARWCQLLSDGFVFVPPREKQVNPKLDTSRWGFAFMLPGWVAANALGSKWSLLAYDPARYGGHQDIYVFQKR